MCAQNASREVTVVELLSVIHTEFFLWAVKMNKSKSLRCLLSFFALVLSAAFSTPFVHAAQPQFVIIGTGGVTGVYYPMGGAICRMVYKYRKQQGLRCSVESTRGSVANLNSVGDGELDLALAQSDSQYHAFNGSDAFSELGANKNLRSVLALHTEPFTIVARGDSGIKSFDDLLGKRVNIGNPGSGQRETMNALMRAKGWQKSDFSLVSELTSVEHSQALCDNKIDAYVFSVGHPVGSIKEAANSCDVLIVSVTGAEVDKLVEEHSYYRRAIIPGGMYRGTDKDVSTFGVSASLTASATSSADIIYLLVKDVFENLESMKKMHPAFATLNKGDMARPNPGVPIHDGAMKYYKEIGLDH